MSKFIVFPAIDLRYGNVVRLRQGKGDQQTVYSSKPKAVATNWLKQGAEWLHVVNLNGAFGEVTEQNEAAVEGIISLGKEKLKDFSQSFVGSEEQVLWERKNEEGFFEGYTSNFIRVKNKSFQNLRNQITNFLIIGDSLSN